MTDPKAVVVYGASGYTGKLIAEYLAKADIAFTAAGRSRERLETAMGEVPGLDPATVRFLEVEHEEAVLTEAFAGARVVVNVVGPFGQLGRPVVNAAWTAGAHYLDTTGEQDWVRDLKRDDHARYAAKSLVLCPALAWMWAGGLIGAELALETPGVDSLDILYAPNGAPTFASTLSFLRMVTKPQHRLVDGVLDTWPAASTVKVAAPHGHGVLIGLPWGGGCEPLWFEDDPRVRNCQVVVGFPDMPLIDWVVSKMHAYLEAAKTQSDDELEALTNAWGLEVAQTPPREIVTLNRCVVSVKARGTQTGTRLTLHNTAPYLQTGAMTAEGVRQLLADTVTVSGFVSPTQAFGARGLGTALARHGLHQDLPAPAAGL